MVRKFTKRAVSLQRVAIRGLTFIVFSGLILVAFYVSIGRIAVSAAGYYKENLSAFLAASLNSEVSIGRLQGSWRYFDPAISVDNLIIGSLSEPAVVLDHVSIRISTFFSLFETNPVLTEIDIDGARLTLVEEDDGSWRVRGLPSSDKPFDFQLILDSTPHLEEVTVKNLELRLEGQKSSYQLSSEEDYPLKIIRDGDTRTVSLPLLVKKVSGEGEVERIHLMGEYEGDLRIAENFEANLYLNVSQISVTDFLPEIRIRQYKLASADIQAEFWLEYAHHEFRLSGTLNSDEVKLADESHHLNLLDHIDIRFVMLSSSVDEGFQVFFPNINIEVENKSFSWLDLNLVVEKTGDTYVVGGNIPTLDLLKLHSSLLALNRPIALIPERALTALSVANPRGRLEATTFYADFSAAAPDLKLTAYIRDATIDAYLGVPAISALNGFASLRPDRGYIDVNNKEYDLHFASMFPSAWPFESTRGRLNYRYHDGVFQLNSSMIEMINGNLSVYGKMHANLPPARENQTWGLMLGINNVDLLDANRYLPKTLSPDLVSWLAKSVLGGRSTESGMVFHGSLYRKAPSSRKVHEIFFRVEDAILDYAESWPSVSDLDATIYVNNQGISSGDVVGTMLTSRIVGATVNVPIPSDGKVDTVVVQGRLKGPLSDGIRILNETPLAETTGQMAESWSGTGIMDTVAHLEIPIGPRSGEEPYSDVTITLKNNNLTMPQFDLSMIAIDGDVKYETKTGLTSSKFNAMLFGEPVSGSIHSLVEGKSGEITVKVNGRVDVKDLYSWSDQTLLTRANGLLAYKAAIHIPYGGAGDRSYVEATSTLQGIVIDMPPPMQKLFPATQMEFYYRQVFLDFGFRVNISVGDKIESAFQVRDGIVTGGRLHFGGGTLGAVSYDKVKVTGTIEHINYEEWDDLIETLDRVSDISIASEMARSLDDIVLDVALLDIFSLELPDTKLRITRAETGWRAELKNGNLAGTVRIGDEENQPVKVQLDYLRFFEEDGNGAEDPFSDTNPQEIVAIDFSTSELLVDGENYGSWKFDFRPGDNGATMENITAQVKGLSIIEPSRAHWTYFDGVHSSEFEGVVVTDDLGSALENWGFASSIEGEDFKFVSRIKWAGSPAMVDLDRVEGPVEIKGGKGRFVQADSGTAALKLLGIFDFNQLGKRFMFDFSDVVSKGYSFDKLKGTVVFDKGIFYISEPIVIEAPGSNFKVGGTVNLLTRKLDNDMIVTLPLGKNLPWYAAYSVIATGPLAGATVFLAQKVLKNQIDQLSSAKYQIGGTIDDPDIQLITIFDDSVREAESSGESTDENSGE
ncbi:MAG: YhdP family protein [Gammaproteobacteria bacterium]|nr:YhdP family protein [Gammaproteobacteria bacterium]